MNVSELYRELKMTKDEFFAKVHELGFDIGERAIKIDDAVAVKIIQSIKEARKSAQKKSIFGEVATPAETEASTSERVLKLPDKITVKQFAEKVGKRVPDTIAILMRNGIMATINETLDYETAAIIAEDLGYKPELSLEEAGIDNVDARAEQVKEVLGAENKANMRPRPPVVVIMGHVDHGKTTLLDTIRSANVTAGEAGGITQHIGAYQVERGGKLITFIDTPGHEAFTTMRSRGARVADIAILVVAADDGVKPQTIESLHILEQAKLPYVVAVNKIDKEGADPERVKKELSELNVIPEEWGGKAIIVPISAKTNTNIDKLLETVLLVGEMEQETIMANPAGETVASIIESHVDKQTGAVATVLVQNGTLRMGDIVLIGNVAGKVRSLKDWQGKEQREAAPGMPVQVLGLKSAPVVGDILRVVKDKKILKQTVKSYNTFSYLKTQRKKEDNEERKKFTIVLRADKLGSLEAIIQSLQGLGTEEVGIDIVQKGLGNITENDIALAKASNATIFGFHAGMSANAEKYARDEGVDVQMYQIIYELIDATKTGMANLLEKKVTFVKIGWLKVLAVFRQANKYSIIGGRVEDGVLKTDSPVKIIRNGTMIGEGLIGQLQKEKKNVSEVARGNECGLRVDTPVQMTAGDVIEAYVAEETSRSL